ncbi:hypothetical protein OC844_001916 [Tilletia horrida]|nr:hypothetical protein OC844_001916 [Tilletia horrida]
MKFFYSTALLLAFAVALVVAQNFDYGQSDPEYEKCVEACSGDPDCESVCS